MSTTKSGHSRSVSERSQRARPSSLVAGRATGAAKVFARTLMAPASSGLAAALRAAASYFFSSLGFTMWTKLSKSFF
jgi:hypothetical protein